MYILNPTLRFWHHLLVTVMNSLKIDKIRSFLGALSVWSTPPYHSFTPTEPPYIRLEARSPATLL